MLRCPISQRQVLLLRCLRKDWQSILKQYRIGRGNPWGLGWLSVWWSRSHHRRDNWRNPRDGIEKAGAQVKALILALAQEKTKPDSWDIFGRWVIGQLDYRVAGVIAILVVLLYLVVNRWRTKKLGAPLDSLIHIGIGVLSCL